MDFGETARQFAQINRQTSQNWGTSPEGGKVTKHPKRPRDPGQLAKLMIDIATGEVEDRQPTPEEQGKRAVVARPTPNDRI